MPDRSGGRLYYDYGRPAAVVSSNGKLSRRIPAPANVFDRILPRMAPAATATVVDDTLDVAALQRAWHGPAVGPRPPGAGLNRAQLTITRNGSGDFQDRQVYLFVDDEPWGKVKYGRPVTREIEPGHHRIRAFNTLFSHTIEIDAVPGEHVRLRCSNAMPTAGWLMMIVLHVTALRVRLERE